MALSRAMTVNFISFLKSNEFYQIFDFIFTFYLFQFLHFSSPNNEFSAENLTKIRYADQPSLDKSIGGGPKPSQTCQMCGKLSRKLAEKFQG